MKQHKNKRDILKEVPLDDKARRELIQQCMKSIKFFHEMKLPHKEKQYLNKAITTLSKINQRSVDDLLNLSFCLEQLLCVWKIIKNKKSTDITAAADVTAANIQLIDLGEQLNNVLFELSKVVINDPKLQEKIKSHVDFLDKAEEMLEGFKEEYWKNTKTLHSLKISVPIMPNSPVSVGYIPVNQKKITKEEFGKISPKIMEILQKYKKENNKDINSEYLNPFWKAKPGDGDEGKGEKLFKECNEKTI